MQEIWKDIEGYEGLYQVSNIGRVKSFPRHGTVANGKIMKQHYDSKGYARVCLSKNGQKQNCKTHRLVAKAFIPNPHHYKQVNHRDENKYNNNVCNLEWCDNRYNATYNERMKKIAKKISRKIRCVETNETFPSISEASRKMGICHSSIVYVCQGKFKQIKGYHFIYED
jgi:hypothetical protein